MKTLKKLAVLASLSFFSINLIYAESLIPAVESGFYYKLGGGADIPMPAFYDTTVIPLNVSGNIGLGFNCGAFNPVAALTNSLNQIKSSAVAVKQQVLTDATAAVTEFPMYELSRSDPDIYNIINDALTGANEDLQISTKSCEVMQSDIASGQDPYANWGQISLGNKWRTEIGDAQTTGNGDINQAKNNVSQDAGRSGVPWVNPDLSAGANGEDYYAGGQGQAPIHILHDTAMAGYRVVLSGNSSISVNRLLGDSQSELQTIWPTPKAAADWITNVVGDETITTYNGGQKSSQPGAGLYSDIESQTQALEPRLQALVNGTSALTLENLQAVSNEGMAISPEMICSVQSQPKIMQAVIVDKLAQNLAAMNVINKTRLAIQILQSGGKIPAVYSNKPAQQMIQNSIVQLQEDVQEILTFVNARQTLVSNMLSTVMQAGNSQVQQNTAIAVPKLNAPVMQNGAISKISN